MAVVTRSTKAPSGGTSWVTGDSISQAALEGDFSGIVTQVNGNLDAANLADDAVTAAKLANDAVLNVNVAASAAIAVSKLDQTAGQLDADIIDDYATDLAEYRTTADPGSSDSVSLPTNLEEQLARMHYALKRAFIGAGTLRTSGTDAAAWFDGVAIGPNLLRNGSFLDSSATPAAPFGWALVGTPAAITPTAFTTQRPEGIGRYVVLSDAVGTGGAADEGVQQTLAGLKASTLYLVEARVLPTTSSIKLVTTGALAGTFDDLAITSASGTGAWATLSGLIWTDTTPTNIVVQLLSTATDYSLGVAHVSVREVVSAAAAATNEHEGTTTRGGQLLRSVTSTQTGNLDGGANDAAFTASLTSTIVVPGPGYQIRVDGVAHFTTGGSAAWMTLALSQNVDGGGASVVQRTGTEVNAGGIGTNQTVPMHYVVEAPTPGSVYVFSLSTTEESGASQYAGSATRLHRLTVQLVNSGF